MKPEKSSYSRIKLGFLLWVVGMIGVVSFLPALPGLLSNLSNTELPVAIWMLQAATLAQTGFLLAVAVVIGVFFAPQVGLSAPVAVAVISRQSIINALKPQLLPGIIGGIIGGLAISIFSFVFLPYLPDEFTATVSKLSLKLSTRLLYGGITEEILIRWGLMTFLVWLPYYTIQKGKGAARKGYYIAAIAISAVIFGLGHLPIANVLFPNITTEIIFYVIIANTLFGLIAGYLFWRYGLESAIIAHMLAHITMLVAERVMA